MIRVWGYSLLILTFGTVEAGDRPIATGFLPPPPRPTGAPFPPPSHRAVVIPPARTPASRPPISLTPPPMPDCTICPTPAAADPLLQPTYSSTPLVVEIPVADRQVPVIPAQKLSVSVAGKYNTVAAAKAEGPAHECAVTLHIACCPGCQPVVKRVLIDNTPLGELLTLDETHSFYDRTVDLKATLALPALVNRTTEEILFEKRKFKSACCEYEVCVPVERSETKTVDCRLYSREVEVRVCYRSASNEEKPVDVYVLNVPGMPPEWVYLKNIPEAKLADFAIFLPKAEPAK